MQARSVHAKPIGGKVSHLPKAFGCVLHKDYMETLEFTDTAAIYIDR